MASSARAKLPFPIKPVSNLVLLVSDLTSCVDLVTLYYITGRIPLIATRGHFFWDLIVSSVIEVRQPASLFPLACNLYTVHWFLPAQQALVRVDAVTVIGLPMSAFW